MTPTEDPGLVSSRGEGGEELGSSSSKSAALLASQANCSTAQSVAGFDGLTGKARRNAKRRAKREATIEPCEPVCVECGSLGSLVNGERIYPHRPDLYAKRFYLCECGAYVGCHPFTRIALGKPAGPTTLAARKAAHNCFDILWRRKMRVQGCTKGEARNAAYVWLAEQLGYEPGKCHIGWMTAAEARAVVRVCDPFVHRRALSSEAQPPVCERSEQGNRATATPLLNTSEADEKR